MSNPHRQALFCFLILLLGTLAATDVAAIVIRHDRDDARYVELGSRFPAAATVLPDGSGVLIAPDWVLTAAHVARGVSSRSPRVEVAGQERAVTRVLVHPDWADMGPHDIALLRLDEPVEGVEPAALYPRQDEVGKTVTFVGRGDTGTGLTGPRSMDRKRRGATNRIVEADDDWIFFTFEEGDEGTDLEGVSGPGDSGGPAFLSRDGKLYTLGVSVFADGKNGPGRYGIREGYTRVSTHRKWVESVLAGHGDAREIPLGAAAGGDDGSGGRRVVVGRGGGKGPDGEVVVQDGPGRRKVIRRGPGEGTGRSDAARRIEGYLEALNSGEFEKMLAFYPEGVTEGFRERRSEEEDRALFERLRNELGNLEAQTMERESPGEVRVTARSEQLPMPVQMTFRLIDDRIDGISLQVGGPTGEGRQDDP